MEEKMLSKREKRQLAKEEKKKERQKSKLIVNLRNWSIGLLVVAGLFFGGYRVWKWISAPVDNSAAQEVLGVTEQDWVKGNSQSSVVLIEYGDFQCPSCAAYSAVVKELSESFSEDLEIVYRHFPLIQIHNNAMNASKAAEAAGRQGKFWEMHDILYQKQGEWADERNAKDKFVSYAEELELDKEKFLNDFNSKEVEEKINNDMVSAKRLNVNATPTFFLNGQKLTDVSKYDDFKIKIEEAINDSTTQ